LKTGVVLPILKIGRSKWEEAMSKVNKISLLLIVLLMLLACVADNSYDLRLQSLVGASTADIKNLFGEPLWIVKGENQEQVWIYDRVSDVYVPSELYTYDQGNEAYGLDGAFSPFLNTYLYSDNPQDFGYDAVYQCETLLKFKNDKLVSWKWSGNDCVVE
jgi:uncharacterized protein YcfL